MKYLINIIIAYDPSFWSLHGAADRLLGIKRIEMSLNTTKKDYFNESWGFKPWLEDSSSGIYLPGRCDWSNVTSSSDLTLPTCYYGKL